MPLLANPVKTSLQARARVWSVSPTRLLLEVWCPCTSVSQSAFLEGTIKLFLLGLHSPLVNGPSEVPHNNVQCACLQFHICNVTMYNVTLQCYNVTMSQCHHVQCYNVHAMREYWPHHNPKEDNGSLIFLSPQQPRPRKDISFVYH